MGITNRYIKSSAVRVLENKAFEAIKAKHPNFPYPVKPKYRDDNTNALTTCIIDYINLQPNASAERINTIGQQIEHRGVKKWVKGSSKTGSSDIHACIKGKFLAIEVKCAATGDVYQRPEQLAYQKEIEIAGGLYMVANDFEQFYNWFVKQGF
ncbi:PDDEXK family nuclease [Flavobacterium rhizosphaerae]|uniref:VRR-NUC domain-containing protein n=1 Tax=Flavobacterium rhizosphaerae TaxID=3163298 RepID=A0ABW8YYV2_9FLAO